MGQTNEPIQTLPFPKTSPNSVEPMATKSSKRIIGIDALRGIAIILMVIFHFVWTLGAFGLVSEEFTYGLGFRRFGYLILSMFLSISGFVSFWSWQKGFTWPRFFKRLWKVGAAALLISLVSFRASKELEVPDMFVFFGVLHHITLGLVLLALIRNLPTWLLGVLAVACFVAPFYLKNPIFNSPLLWWVGLCTETPATVDYVSILPWFCVMIAGAILARLVSEKTVLNLAGHESLNNPMGNVLAWMGRYSLIIYLIHPPILFGLVFLATYLMNRFST